MNLVAADVSPLQLNPAISQSRLTSAATVQRFTRIVCIAAVLMLLPSCATTPEPKRPNIVFVLTDDQGYGDLSCLGNPILKTPNIDRFHAESVRFTDFHVSPTCAPTRSALLTGRHEFRNGVTHTILERERMTTNANTIVQVLQRAGYTTGIFGKWHLGDEAAYQPGRRGFDEVFIHGAGGIGQTYAGSCGDAPGNSYFNPAILHNGRFVKTSGYCTDVFFSQALKWIDAKRQSKQPFFAYITPNAPHAPLDVPPEYEKIYAGRVPTNAAKFFGMIANIDDNFGRLLAKLKQWNLERDTLVIFMTDNGGTAGVQVFNAGMRGAKVTPYGGGTRVPSFWRWPAAFKGGVDVNKLTAHIDVFRTFAEIAGAKLGDQRAASLQLAEGTRPRLPVTNRQHAGYLPLERQVEGRSLLSLLKDPAAPWSDRILITHVGRWERGQAAQSKYRNCSVRNSRFHLVSAKRPSDVSTSPSWELFDLKSDPGEKTNVIAQFPLVARELEWAYDGWWQETLPHLVNEDVISPQVNPFKELYWKQFGGGPEQ